MYWRPWTTAAPAALPSHALGDNANTDVTREPDDRVDGRRTSRIDARAIDERLRDLHPQLTQLRQHLVLSPRQLRHRALGHVELQVGGVQAPLSARGNDVTNQLLAAFLIESVQGLVRSGQADSAQ